MTTLALPLGRLALCLEDDCGVAFDSTERKACPSCGSRTWALIAKWLGPRTNCAWCPPAAPVSHGICPRCMRVHFPEVAR